MPYAVADLQPLSAKYIDFQGDTEGSGQPRHWEFDFSGVGPAGDFDVDAVVKHVDGSWELMTDLGSSGTASICDATEVELVISNHDRTATVGGTLTVKVLDEPCTCQIIEPYMNQPWDATYDLSYRRSASRPNSTGYTRVTVDHSYHAAATLSHWAGSWVTGTLSSGVGTIADERYFRDPNGNESTTTLSGNGPPVVYDGSGLGPWSIGELAIQLDTCTYSVRQQIAVTAVEQPGGESGTEPIGMVAIDGLPVGQGTELSGATDLPVRWLSYQIPFYHAGG